MSHAAYKLSPSFCTKAKVANGGVGGGGAILRDTMVYDLSSAVIAS